MGALCTVKCAKASSWTQSLRLRAFPRNRTTSTKDASTEKEQEKEEEAGSSCLLWRPRPACSSWRRRSQLPPSPAATMEPPRPTVSDRNISTATSGTKKSAGNWSRKRSRRRRGVRRRESGVAAMTVTVGRGTTTGPWEAISSRTPSVTSRLLSLARSRRGAPPRRPRRPRGPARISRRCRRSTGPRAAALGRGRMQRGG